MEDLRARTDEARKAADATADAAHAELTQRFLSVAGARSVRMSVGPTASRAAERGRHSPAGARLPVRRRQVAVQTVALFEVESTHSQVSPGRFGPPHTPVRRPRPPLSAPRYWQHPYSTTTE